MGLLCYPHVIWKRIERFMHAIRVVRACFAENIPLHEQERETERARLCVSKAGGVTFDTCVAIDNGRYLMCNGRSVFVAHVAEETRFLYEVECVGAGLRALQLCAYGDGCAFLTETITEFMHIVPVTEGALRRTNIEPVAGAALSHTALLRNVVTGATRQSVHARTGEPDWTLAVLKTDGTRLCLATYHIQTPFSDLCIADLVGLGVPAELRHTVSLAFYGHQLVVAACAEIPGSSVSHLCVIVHDVGTDCHVERADKLWIEVPSTNPDRFFLHRTKLRRAKGGIGLIVTCTCFPTGVHYMLE